MRRRFLTSGSEINCLSCIKLIKKVVLILLEFGQLEDGLALPGNVSPEILDQSLEELVVVTSMIRRNPEDVGLLLDFPVDCVQEQDPAVVFFGKEIQRLLVGFVGNLVSAGKELLDVVHLVNLLEKPLGELLGEPRDDVDFVVLGDFAEEFLKVGTQFEEVELRVLVEGLDFELEDLGVALHVTFLLVGEADVFDLQAENVLLSAEEIDSSEDVLDEFSFLERVIGATQRHEGVQDEENDEEDVGYDCENELEDQHHDVDEHLEDLVEVEKDLNDQLEEN